MDASAGACAAAITATGVASVSRMGRGGGKGMTLVAFMEIFGEGGAMAVCTGGDGLCAGAANILPTAAPMRAIRPGVAGEGAACATCDAPRCWRRA